MERGPLQDQFNSPEPSLGFTSRTVTVKPSQRLKSVSSSALSTPTLLSLSFPSPLLSPDLPSPAFTEIEECQSDEVMEEETQMKKTPWQILTPIEEQADDSPQHECDNSYSETEYDELRTIELIVEASPPGSYIPLEYYLRIHHILPQVNEVLMRHNPWAQYKPCEILPPSFEDLPPGRWFYRDGTTPSDTAVIHGLVVPFIQFWGKSGEMWIIGGCQQAPVAMKLEYSTFALARDMQWDYLRQRFGVAHL